MQKEDLQYLWSRWMEKNKLKPIFNGFYSGAQSFYDFTKNYLELMENINNASVERAEEK